MAPMALLLLPVLAYDYSFYHQTDSLLEAFTRLSEPPRCGARLVVDTLRDVDDPNFGLRIATF